MGPFEQDTCFAALASVISLCSVRSLLIGNLLSIGSGIDLCLSAKIFASEFILGSLPSNQ